MSDDQQHEQPQPRGLLAPGTLLAQQYVVGEPIAITELSVIYRGRTRATGLPVVVKCMAAVAQPGGFHRETLLRNMRREAALLARLRHQQIPRLHAVGMAEGQFCIVMEFVAGVPLDRWLEQRQLTVAQAFAILLQLSTILSYLHGLYPPLIHADIKPSNLLMTSNGKLVLIDFGLARSYHPDSWDAEPAGTLPYAPPEQRRGAPLDERSDLYALGVLVQELFDAAGRGDQVTAIVRRATALDPAQRYPTVGRLTAEVERAVSVRPLRFSHPAVRRRRARQGLRALAALLLIVVLLLAAIVVGAQLQV